MESGIGIGTASQFCGSSLCQHSPQDLFVVFLDSAEQREGLLSVVFCSRLTSAVCAAIVSGHVMSRRAWFFVFYLDALFVVFISLSLCLSLSLSLSLCAWKKAHQDSAATVSYYRLVVCLRMA